MNRWAVIENDTVVNVIVWDGSEPAEISGEVVEIDANSPLAPGYRRVNGEWIAPPAPEPHPIDIPVANAPAT